MTMASTVQAVLEMLGDEPEHVYLTVVVSASDTTFTVGAGDIGKVGVGNILEIFPSTVSPTTVESVRVRATDPANLTFTVERAYRGEAEAHGGLPARMMLNPRFTWTGAITAVNTVLATDLYNAGVIDLQEHQITSSATTNAYNAPTVSCEEFLQVVQMPATLTEPVRITDFERLGWNIDNSLYNNYKVFFIRSNVGTPGTDLYYVTCAHKHTISTLTGRSQRIVEWLAAAYMLEWTEPRRTAGPTNQGDRTVRPGQAIATASYYRELARKAMADERSDMRRVNPPQKVFRRA